MNWLAALCIVTTLGTEAAGTASAAALADHRALYKMTLARSTPGSDIVGLSGEMAFEVKSTCNGSTVTQYLRTNTWGEESVVRQGAMTVSSFESKDGKSFQFALHNEIDGRVVQDFKGTLTRATPASDGKIAYEKDAFPPASFPAGGIFPNQYMAKLLAAAENNERIVAVTVFDGSEDGKIFRSTSIIGPRDVNLKSKANQLKGLAHWPMVLSYFDLSSDSPTPDYESSFDLYENGVSDRMVLDYGDFAMKGEITSLQLLTPPRCN